MRGELGPKSIEVLLKLISGTEPMPETDMVWGVPVPVSSTETVAERKSCAVGENVTLMMQEAPLARAAGSVPQVFVCAKSPAFAPVREMVLTVIVAPE